MCIRPGCSVTVHDTAIRIHSMMQHDKCSGQARVILITAAVACSLIGCRNDPYQTARVRGRLTCSGSPVPSGIIQFAPLESADGGRKSDHPGKPATGMLNENGEFDLSTYKEGDGALIGQHEVRFVPLYGAAEIRDLQNALKSNELDATNRASIEETLNKILAQPKLNCGHAVEPKEVTIEPGRNTFELKLVSKG